jgi:hypothetical protein
MCRSLIRAPFCGPARLALAIALVLAGWGPARAQAGIEIGAISAAFEFGREMVFTLEAASPNDIVEATLFLELDARSRVSVTAAEFQAGPAVTPEVRRDLRQQPIAPFSNLMYWWRVVDGAGEEVVTDRTPLLYEDNRFEWRAAEREPVTVHWHDGDAAFGQAAADTAALALAEISQDISAPPPARVDIYVYAAVADLQSGLELNGRTWVGGHADPDLGVALVAAPPGAEALLDLERDIPHELTHILVYQATAPNYPAVPAWLNEGLAVLHEREPNPAYRIVLETARAEGRLLSLAELCGAFPLDSGEAALAYAQSASVVGYIRDRWGAAGIRRLLDAYADRATCDGGVPRALEISLAGLENDWKRDALGGDPLGAIAAQVAPWLLLLLLPGLALLALLLGPRRRPASRE